MACDVPVTPSFICFRSVWQAGRQAAAMANQVFLRSSLCLPAPHGPCPLWAAQKGFSPPWVLLEIAGVCHVLLFLAA